MLLHTVFFFSSGFLFVELNWTNILSCTPDDRILEFFLKKRICVAPNLPSSLIVISKVRYEGIHLRIMGQTVQLCRDNHTRSSNLCAIEKCSCCSVHVIFANRTFGYLPLDKSWRARKNALCNNHFKIGAKANAKQVMLSIVSDLSRYSVAYDHRIKGNERRRHCVRHMNTN